MVGLVSARGDFHFEKVDIENVEGKKRKRKFHKIPDGVLAF